MNDPAHPYHDVAGSPLPTTFKDTGRAILLAIVLTLVLTTGWTISGWNGLRLLRLPDNDDMMRLAQVRDWIAGQPFNDLSQYRLGPPSGAPMHWSRIADAIPASMILLLRPFFGQSAAEMTMVLTYPALLLFAYMLLLGDIAARLIGRSSRITAMILAALAFPTISLFIPGRIDHHALQIVLVLVSLNAAAAPARLMNGIVIGAALALSLAVGLETAPEIVALLSVLGLGWVVGDAHDDARIGGIGVSLGGLTLLMLAVARPWVWPEQWCDGFTPGSTRATLLLAGAFAALGVAGRGAKNSRVRFVIAAIVGLTVAIAAIMLAPACFGGPYRALDPFLKYVWMSNVSEAKDIYFGQDTLGTSVAFGGLCLVGLIVGIAGLRRDDWRVRPAWVGFLIFLTLSTVAAMLQIRVVYVLAGIAVLPIAAAIDRTRRNQDAVAARLGLWVIGAGITYNIAAGFLDSAFAEHIQPARVAARACTQGEPILVPGRQPVGTVMAPLDLGSYFMGMTPHYVVAAGYHRNNTGNVAMYRFFLATPEDAAALARRWGIDYVALCPENLRETELLPMRGGSLADRLQGSAPPPAWLQPIATGGSLRFYKVLQAR
jgi:hypothetical protein